ncbi:hypothetical protein ABEB36_002176 [Hypothenemus hampei]|uniref:Alpha-methylacyl-CoA racemase n=1 Tax=Hypothenemus hampei TaxID=57062 RepID=A0ABD1F4W8_HYPHA
MALKGIRVVEFAGLAPAPFCGMILADFGASIIRIDRKGANGELDCLSNGKRSLSLDLKRPESIEIIRRLIKKSDVSIEPFRNGVMESLGLGPNVLMQDNSKLIYARLSGYGQSGPYAKKAGHDINFLALSGLLSLFGRKDENPIFPANLAADFGGGGLMCALGILLALYEREKSGKGQIVDTNMVQGVSYLGSFLYRSQSLIWGNKRGCNLLDSGAPFYEVYKTKDDKYMAVGAIEGNFYQELLKGLDISQEEAPQFNFEQGRKLFTTKFREKTRSEWCNIFEKLDACVVPVLDINETAAFEHNKAQGTFAQINNEIVPNPSPNLSRTPAESTAKRNRPSTGEHTFEILKELDYEPNEILKLRDEGVIFYENKSKL